MTSLINTLNAANTRTATAKQIVFIGKLSAERGVNFDAATWVEGPASRESRTEIDRLLAMPKAAKPKTTAAPAPTVPEGHYATASATGNNDLDFWVVQKPVEGKWAGYTFVKRVIGGHPDTPVKGAAAKAALEAIAKAGVEASGKKYADELGRCYRCNKSLTDDESRARGLGSHCAGLV